MTMQPGQPGQATVRANTLPVNNNPNVQRRTLPEGGQPVQQTSNVRQSELPGTQAAGPGDGATPPPADPRAPTLRKKYGKRAGKEKLSVVAGLSLTQDEQAAFGRISLKALERGISPAAYIEQVKRDVGHELAVWEKINKQVAQPEIEEESEDAPLQD